jgi:hypothetical protein
VRHNSRLLLFGLFLAACGGGAADATGEVDPALVVEDGVVAPPAVMTSADSAALAAKPPVTEAFDTAAARGERPLLREVYGWRGGGRDPFRPLVTTQAGGPELVDLILTSVLYQPSNPDASVAIFRDAGNNQRFTVNVGDRIGRLSVVSITEGTATLRMNDFGTNRDRTYSLRRTEDGNP